MNPMIILAKSTTTATIEIIILMLVAGIVAYFTAYFYYRSEYLKIIKKLEVENEGLKHKADGLQAANRDLNKQVEELEKQLQEKK